MSTSLKYAALPNVTGSHMPHLTYVSFGFTLKHLKVYMSSLLGIYCLIDTLTH